MDIDRAILDGAAAAIIRLYNRGFLETGGFLSKEEAVRYYFREVGITDEEVILYWLRYCA